MTSDRILIVDDNLANLKVTRLTLESAGYDVRIAANAAEALLAVTEFRPRLILMDIQLPDMNGLELTSQLKGESETRDIVIVAVTAFAMNGDRERSLAAGCQGYITKPIDPLRLPLQVASFLQDAPEEEPVAEDTARLAGDDGAAPTVLLVEDNPTTRKMFRISLQTAGYEVTEAANGCTALQMVDDNPPALIIQDLNLPDIDGRALLRSFQASVGGAAVPVICVSGFLSKLDEVGSMENGFAKVLMKPVDPILLIDVVETQLGARGQAYAARPESLRPPLGEEDDSRSGLDESSLTGAKVTPAYNEKVHAAQGTDSLADRARQALWQLERQVEENSRLSFSSGLRAAQLAVLAGAAKELTSPTVSNEMLGDVLGSSLDMAGISKAILYLLDAEERFVVTQRIGFSNAEVFGLDSVLKRTGLLTEVTKKGDVLLVPSPAVTRVSAQQLILAAGVASLLVVPLVWEKTIFGATIMGAGGADVTGEDALNFARALGRQMGQAICLTRAFDRLASGEERFRTLAQSLDEYVFTLDTNQCVTGAFGRGFAHDSRSANESIGRKWYEALGSGHLESHQSANRRALSCASVAYEWSQARPDHEGRRFHTVISPVRQRSESVVGLVCVSRDITGERRIRTEPVVSDRMAALGALVGSASSGGASE